MFHAFRVYHREERIVGPNLHETWQGVACTDLPVQTMDNDAHGMINLMMDTVTQGTMRYRTGGHFQQVDASTGDLTMASSTARLKAYLLHVRHSLSLELRSGHWVSFLEHILLALGRLIIRHWRTLRHLSRSLRCFLSSCRCYCIFCHYALFNSWTPLSHFKHNRRASR